MQGLILIGSLANRDFVPGLSDVDLWVLGRRLKPGLRIERAKLAGLDLDVNLVCRNGRFLRRMLRERNPVDLVAMRHGEVLHGAGRLAPLRRRGSRLRADRRTCDAWMKSSARWLGRALDEYFCSTCAHCFFGALYHASRDMLRARLVGAGEDLTEGWETEAALMKRWPDLAEKHARIRHARANWEWFDFPLFKDRVRLEGDLGDLIRTLWGMARAVYRGAGLKLPPLEPLLHSIARRRGKGGMFWTIRPDTERLMVAFHRADGKLRFLKRRLGA